MSTVFGSIGQSNLYIITVITKKSMAKNRAYNGLENAIGATWFMA